MTISSGKLYSQYCVYKLKFGQMFMILQFLVTGSLCMNYHVCEICVDFPSL